MKALECVLKDSKRNLRFLRILTQYLHKLLFNNSCITYYEKLNKLNNQLKKIKTLTNS